MSVNFHKSQTKKSPDAAQKTINRKQDSGKSAVRDHQRQITPANALDWQQSFGNTAVSRVLSARADVSENSAEVNRPNNQFMNTVSTVRGSGNTLPANLKRSIEQELHTQLGTVRVHTDERANALSQSISATAFTAGNDIFFSQGAYNPHTLAGIQLLRHELMHVTQQGGHFSPNNMHLGEPGSAGEKEARDFSRTKKPTINSGRPLPFSAAGVIQRDDEFTKMGGGSANEVYEVTHDDTSKGYFKPDAEKVNSSQETSPLKPLSNMGARSVLSSDTDRLLGLNVLSKETYRTHEGRGGSESSAVKGTTVLDNDFNTEITKDRYDVVSQMAPASYKQKKVGAADKYYQQSGATFNRHDFSHPTTQKDLANLQLGDSIMGQMDRHGGNIKIDDETHQARGFDNDLLDITTPDTQSSSSLRSMKNLHSPTLFGKKKPKTLMSEQEKAAKVAAREAARTKLNTPGGNMLGLPSHIDEATAQRIKGMKSKAFMAQLQARNPENAARMDPAHLQELKERYSVARRYVKEGFLPANQRKPDSPQIVGNGGWNQSTYLAQVNQGNKDYVGRSVTDYNRAQAGAGGQIDDHGLIYKATQAHLGPLPTTPPPVHAPVPAHAAWGDAVRPSMGAARGNFSSRTPTPPPVHAPALPPPMHIQNKKHAGMLMNMDKLKQSLAAQQRSQAALQSATQQQPVPTPVPEESTGRSVQDLIARFGGTN